MTKLGRSKPRYSDSFKALIIKKLIEQDYSIVELSRQYGVSTRTITRWIDRFTNGNNSISLHSQTQKTLNKRKSHQDDSKEALLKQIEQLEASLEKEKMRSQAFKTMIEIAQKKFNISIEKKSGSKQSKK
ncbi:MAG: transposase [Flavobacteriaceae bacterium]|nr:transposase [Flavobacteriaceae bacterium]